MTKKDYIRAAEITRRYHLLSKETANDESRRELTMMAQGVQEAFVQFFLFDPNFDEKRFREACQSKEER